MSKPRKNNKKDKARLEKTIEICQALLDGRVISLSDSELNCWPPQFPILSKSKAKKHGLVLKRGAKPVCEFIWQLTGGGKATGKFYLLTSYKLK